MKRLRKYLEEMSLFPRVFKQAAGAGLAREQEELTRWITRLHENGEFNPVHSWKYNIDHCKIGSPLFEDFQSSFG